MSAPVDLAALDSMNAGGTRMEQSSARQREQLSREALRQAISSLSPADMLRLHKKAKFFSPGTGMEPADLLQEAIARTLQESDGRNCPADVSVPVFLGNAMRSIADGERDKARRIVSLDQDSAASTITATDGRTPEDAVAAVQQLDQIWAQLEHRFADDPQAIAVMLGLAEECTADEIKEIEPMSQHEYEAARKRVRRELERLSHRGLKQ